MESYDPYTTGHDLGVAGKSHGDTQSFNDADLLAGCVDVRLQKIRVWYDEYVHGIQTVYETSNKGIITSPKRIKEGTKKTTLDNKEIMFNRDEFITGIKGHAGDIIDHVKFYTNKGRELRFGRSEGGNEFSLDVPVGMCVVTIRGGYGGHLHNIGGSYAHMKVPLQYQYTYGAATIKTSKMSVGPTHGDTVLNSDVEYLEGTEGQHRITEIGVYYREGECVLGLRVTYNENGKEIVTKGTGGYNKGSDKFEKFEIDPEDFLVDISGYFGDY